MLGLLAKKVGMTQIFDENGDAIPVTILELLENVVTEKKTKEKTGYTAIQIGANEASKEEKLSKPELGNLKKNNLPLFRILKEFRVSGEEVEKYELGKELNPAEVLGDNGCLVDVTGRPIGRGTSGRIKRWNQHRRLMTHGTKHHRQIGSAGPGTTPGRVFKGLKMAGRDNEDITISKLTLVKYVPEQKALLIKGAVPGHKGAIVSVKPSNKKGEWNRNALLIGKRKAA
ncbi:MAG: 50S ribosomal protein L3 [Candidatus Caenarcaniphilales bacterium]|nr:50S ribosomal protein L3 [Candidatus Caenarcaniphilales bacterium]